MVTARKKVLVRRHEPGVLRSYLPSANFIRDEKNAPVLDLLDLEGRLQVLPLHEIRQISFVREFHAEDDQNPERLPRKTFSARPRTEGLWVRLTFVDGEQIDGLASLDLSLADGLIDDRGLQLIPPDVRGNTLRMYVPRTAMAALQVVAVVTTPTRKKLERSVMPAEAAAQLALELAEPAN